MKSFKYFLEEGKNDPAIFKAVFMAGGPGSGKSFVAKKLALKALGYRTINSDDAFEFLMKKNNIDFKMTSKQLSKRDELRHRAKDITGSKHMLSIRGRLGVIIDGTGKEYDKIKKIKENLEEIGYETFMVIVNTSLETSLERNANRARTVPTEIVTQSWKEVQSNIGKFQNLFNRNFSVIDNDGNTVQVTEPFKKIMNFTKSKPHSKKARDWIEKQ